MTGESLTGGVTHSYDTGIDRWNVLENAGIRSRDRASIQTSRHGRENEERSSLHKQLIFVAFGVP